MEILLYFCAAILSNSQAAWPLQLAKRSDSNLKSEPSVLVPAAPVSDSYGHSKGGAKFPGQEPQQPAHRAYSNPAAQQVHAEAMDAPAGLQRSHSSPPGDRLHILAASQSPPRMGSVNFWLQSQNVVPSRALKTLRRLGVNACI